MAMSDLQRYPEHIAVSVYFHLRFLIKSELHISCLLESMEKLSEITELNICMKNCKTNTFLV